MLSPSTPVASATAVAEIDALLPQTQCQRCGYADCYDYANAIAQGHAEINRCPPGGTATRIALGALLQRDLSTFPPLADDVDAYAAEHVALIDESRCIGCAKCLPVCPTDAIIGATKRMHTVIAQDCTGCELCIIACPVNCIDLAPQRTFASAAHDSLGQRAAQSSALRAAYTAHKIRFTARAEDGLSAMLVPAATNEPVDASVAQQSKAALLASIMAKAKARQ